MLIPRISQCAGLFVIAGLIAAARPAEATPPECIAINQSRDVTYRSLATAIADASGGDTIKVMGTCRGSFLIDKNLKLVGRQSDQHEDTIDGSGFTARTLTTTANVEIRSLSIRGSSVDTGQLAGGIFNSATLALIDSSVTGHRALIGGAIFNTGTMTIQDSSILHNTSQSWGGGIYNGCAAGAPWNPLTCQGSATGKLTIIRTRIGENPSSPLNGNGIFNEGTLVFTQSVVEDNALCLAGGGISNVRGAARR